MRKAYIFVLNLDSNIKINVMERYVITDFLNNSFHVKMYI